MFKKMRCVLMSLLVLFSPALFATNSPSVDIHQVCVAHAQQCLQQIGSVLANTPQNSRQWYQYKLYELSSLFRLVKFEELINKVEPWISKTDVPLKFKIQALIYFGKTLRAQENTEQGNRYLQEAIDTLSLIHQDSQDPMLLVQIGNALNSLERYQEGYDLLISVERKYHHRNDPVLKEDLYTNLGHMSQQLGKNEQHILYREEVVKWANLHPDKNRLVVATYNLARAHQIVTNYDAAVTLFNEARIKSLAINNHYLAEMCLFQLAKIAHAKGQKDKAIALMESIDYNHITISLRDNLINFNDELGIDPIKLN